MFLCSFTTKTVYTSMKITENSLKIEKIIKNVMNSQIRYFDEYSSKTHWNWCVTKFLVSSLHFFIFRALPEHLRKHWEIVQKSIFWVTFFIRGTASLRRRCS